MTYINRLCADAGTVNCPCPLAETGDCLVCGKLSGRGECDCGWAGVCIYNEYIQNGSIIRGKRENRRAEILKKIWYGSDLLVIVLAVPKGFALEAAQPGAFVFVNSEKGSSFANVPVSVMKADPEKGHLFIALKIISSKTKAVAEERNYLQLRGVYRNGLLGRGIEGMLDDIKMTGGKGAHRKWLIICKGVGFAPAVNLVERTAGTLDMDFLIDTEKVNEEIVMDYLQSCAVKGEGEIRFYRESLQSITDTLISERAKGRAPAACAFNINSYDRVIILASDYYVKMLAEYMEIPSQKLVFCNNFKMCCGEGICGACSHIDSGGNVNKMCKCKGMDLKTLL